MKQKTKPEPSKFEIIGELLRLYGMGIIDEERFCRDMARHSFTQDDVDWWCREHYARDVS